MTLQDGEPHKGKKGAKRSSWASMHFRPMAEKICADNPQLVEDDDIEKLGEIFIEEVKKNPAYLESIGVYIMANVVSSLNAKPYVRRTPEQKAAAKAAAEEAARTGVVAQVAVRVLMKFRMPSGKLLEDSTGAECTKCGGWLAKVGEHVGPRGIVGKKMTEAQLRRMFKETK